MKFITFIIILFFPFFASAQNEIPPEWIEMDVSIFKHFFDNFPLHPETSENDLMIKLIRFKNVSHDSIGFDGILDWWALPGGTISINSNIVSYHGKVAMVETIIYQDYVKRLNHVFEKDKVIEEKFFKYFKLQVNPNYFNDSLYIYLSINDSIFQNYKIHVAEYLGKQKNVDLFNYDFEYNLLNNPTGSYQFDESYFKYSNDYPPVLATQKLVSENRADCLINIIKGYSLPGRMYGIMGIIELVQQNKYTLTSSDKELLRKVLELDLHVEGGYDLITEAKYADCLNEVILKLIEK
jgi:hypothetical protein